MAGDQTNWTIMLYITADGTLTNFAVESLNQLNQAVSSLPNTEPVSVKVAAHFSFPGPAATLGAAGEGVPANQSPREYIFLPQGAPVNHSLVRTLPKPGPVSKQTNTLAQVNTSSQANTSEKEALKAFLNGVYDEKSGLKSDHYALILWGHGPELLLQPPADNSNSDGTSLYLTPEELREVLEKCIRDKGRHLNIIGFDACFMSMFEMAAELKGLVDYMVASQDEVPDLSFPYDNLIKLFGEHDKLTIDLLTADVRTYVTTYQDCVCNDTTEMNPVTLSVLQLDKCKDLTDAVKSLACALLRANDEAKRNKALPKDLQNKALRKDLQEVLIEARKFCKDYAGGLYVDLYDFCELLNAQLGKLKKTDAWITAVGDACQSVKKALDSEKDSPVLVNGSVEISRDGKNAKAQVNGSEISEDEKYAKELLPAEVKNHGISIYLPYLTETQYAQAQRPLVKGTPGSHSGKGFGDVLNGAGLEYLMCVRRDLILDTESYYPRLKLADETKWYDFITEVWTSTLMEKVPADLDYHYSAQQSWMNVTRNLRDPVDPEKLCP